jgi:hypothetical protein
MTDDEKAAHQRYQMAQTALWTLGCCPIIAAELNAARKSWAQHRDEMLIFQKECGQRKNIEGAKFFKDAASDALKHYRGACLVLGWCGLDLGDCPTVPLTQWPIEIAPFALAEVGQADLRAYQAQFEETTP